MTYEPGQRVEYIAEGVFDLIIDTGDIGTVTKVEGGWVFAAWPRSGVHSVPLTNVRLVADRRIGATCRTALRQMRMLRRP